jgi:CO/xanthine dehydrogenase Mo-binding subunit
MCARRRPRPRADDHGAVVHGIDASLLEGMQYDADGEPLTVTFAD